MWNDTIMISPKYTLADYQNLNVTTNSDTKTWNKAIDIFVDRIYGRFFAPIETLLNDFDAPEKNGFAIMALNCLLTETMLQFAECEEETGGQAYSNFLTVAFPEVFENQKKARRFYRGIRCGILHGAQTNKKARLSYDEDYVVSLTEDEILYVSVPGYYNILRNYFEDYVEKLRERADSALAENFVKKMTLICQKS